MITHDADDSFDLADEVILLDQGNIVARGNPEELYKRPINEHSARFFSESDIIEKDETNLSFFNRFEINSNRICVSPQSISITNNGTQAKVIAHKFVGNGYMVILDCLGAKLKMFTTEKITSPSVLIGISDIIEL
jgi:ABC-type Fe3+/spermidine/putrescine transport system ATPase subunit